MIMSGIDVRPSALADDEERDRFVRGALGGTFFHLSGWRRAVERVMHHTGSDLLAYRGGEMVGVLPYLLNTLMAAWITGASTVVCAAG